MKEAYAKTCLERANALTRRGLLDTDSRYGARKVQFFCYGNEMFYISYSYAHSMTCYGSRVLAAACEFAVVVKFRALSNPSLSASSFSRVSDS